MFKKHDSSFVFSFQREKGMTMIELLIIIVLVSALVAISVPIYSNLRVSSKLNESTNLLIQTLRTAKERSSARLNNIEHGIKLETNYYTIYYGTSYTTRTQDYDRDITLTGIDLSWTLSGTGDNDDINFSKGLGIPNKTGSITLTDVAGNTKNITINEIGKVEQ